MRYIYVSVFSKIEQNTHTLLPTEMKSTLETLSFGKLMNSDSPDLISILACLLAAAAAAAVILSLPQFPYSLFLIELPAS